MSSLLGMPPSANQPPENSHADASLVERAGALLDGVGGLGRLVVHRRRRW